MAVHSPYYETKLYEHNSLVSNSTNIEGLKGTFCMNHRTSTVNHNAQNFDGNDAFHGMGILASLTPLVRFSIVLERRKFVTSRQITEPNQLPLNISDRH